MNGRLKLLLILMLGLSPGKQCLASQYELVIDDATPTSGTVRLVLDSALNSDTTLTARQLRDSSIDDPVCVTSGTKLRRQDAGWLATAGCSEISWKIHFHEVLEPEHDVSAQVNLYYPGRWWLFSEWGSLLRPEANIGGSRICARSGTDETCRRVPAVDEPPLLMLFGESARTMTLGGTSFNFFTGHLPEDFDLTGMHESYESQIDYLHAVMTEATGTSPPDAIDVLLLGIDSARGAVGGAAGVRSYLTNVAVGEQRVDPSERTRLLWVSGHELAHLLGLGTEALWASESLAHYYGFKSLGRSRDASELFARMGENVDQMALLEAHRRVTREGEGQYYPLFYTKGALFWREVDQAITAATQREKSLDDYLRLLINGDFGPNGELPGEFVEAVSTLAGGGGFEGICEKFL